MPNEEQQTVAETTPVLVAVDPFPTHSPQTEKIAEALAKAQGSMDNASKASNNPFFGSKYADLAEVINVSRKSLTDNGLALTQVTIPVQGKSCLVTTLLHTSGQWIKSYDFIEPVPMKTKDEKGATVYAITPQAKGSAMTYSRRYQYSAVVGVAQEDDDGNAASGQRDAKPQGASEESKATLRQAFKDGLIPVEEAEFEKTLATMGEAQARAAIAKYAPKPKNDARSKVADIQNGGDNV